jgi:hypothetical protein
MPEMQPWSFKNEKNILGLSIRVEINQKELYYNYYTSVILNFNWTHTAILGQAQTKQAREFKEAWHSMD